MDKCGICSKPAQQLFETDKDGVYACFKCQPLVPEITIEDNGDTETEQAPDASEEDSQPLYCGICHKTFQKSLQLQNHLRNHKAEKRFLCTYCNKAFSQSNNLRAHLRIHTNERPFKCTECGKAFTQVTNLNNHVRLHTGERPFVCDEPGCDKAFAQVTNLNQHRKRHLSGRPVELTYDCTICGQQFSQRNHMYAHRREEHAEVSKGAARQRAYQCELCDVTMPSERQLKRHVERHAAGSDSADDSKDNKEESYACVFKACGAVLASARAHTDHLLHQHQLRVLAARAPHPPRRGRPPKVKNQEHDDPLAFEEAEIEEVTIVDDQIHLVPRLKVKSMFQ